MKTKLHLPLPAVSPPYYAPGLPEAIAQQVAAQRASAAPVGTPWIGMPARPCWLRLIQAIAKDCADTVGVQVRVVARLNLKPGQKLKLICTHG